jgi:hypothetical protein
VLVEGSKGGPWSHEGDRSPSVSWTGRYFEDFTVGDVYRLSCLTGPSSGRLTPAR